MIHAGVIGGAGYTGGELLRLLMNHEKISIHTVVSQSQSGRPIGDIHQDLKPFLNLEFSDSIDLNNIDVLFLCSGHGHAIEFMGSNTIPNKLKIIDLSHDYRIGQSPSGFVYGLPEVFKSRITEASRIANPGCFATAIQLALAPVAAQGILTEDIHVSAITGSTGAGQSLSATSHFSWRSNNVSVYKSFSHQHLGEITQTIDSLQPSFKGKINFIPMRGAFTRGILASVHFSISGQSLDWQNLYKSFYQAQPFVHICSEEPDLKLVVNTNHCFLSVAEHDGYLHIVSVIDNLIKGAVGQAIQNCNLMFGFEENCGLKLKASSF